MRNTLLSSLLTSLAFALALGCQSDDRGSGRESLSTDDPPATGEQPDGCHIICQSYDESDCRVVCPPPPPDASVPDDPYAQ